MKTGHKPRVIITLIAILALNYQLSIVCGQGTAFTYQGRLNDGPNPAAGTYDLRFALFDFPGGGIQQGITLTNPAAVVSNGLFTVTLDFGNQFPGAGRWLEIGARTNGPGAFATLSPRQQLVSTPYAIQAANAGTATSANSVAATNVSGTLSTAQLPASVVTNGASGVNFSGAFAGNGSSLTNVPGTMPWHASSATNLTATANQGYVLSNNSPTTVTLPTSANVGDVVTISGQLFAGFVRQVSAPWTGQNSGVQNLNGLAASADGTKLLAVGRPGQLSTSSDGGMTWTPRSVGLPPIGNQWWGAVASSADGAKLVAAIDGGSIYTSADSGATWTERTNSYPNASFPNGLFWRSVASSTDGTKLIAAHSPGLIYASTNSGLNWFVQTNGLPGTNQGWVAVASSADGVKLVAVPGSGNSAIYTSTNSGATWAAQFPPTFIPWASVASSGDGTKLALVANGYPVYTSADSGVTWTPQNNSTNLYWKAITMSADGTKLLACAFAIGPYPGIVAVSIDSGVNWTLQTNGLPNGGSANWYVVASSTDGTKLAVGAFAGTGPIYTSTGGPIFQGSAPGVTTEFQYLGNGVWQTMEQSASQLVGTISTSNLPPSVITNNQSGTTLSGNFSGNGSGLTNLDAGKITAGTLADARLSANVPLLNGTNQFTGTNRFAGVTIATNGANQIVGTFAGNGTGLSNLPASQISGTLSFSQLPSILLTNGALSVNLTGSFAGSGAGLTNVPGTMPWQTVAGTNLTASANQAYLLTNQALSTVTLPTSANPGDIVTVSGVGSNGWQVTSSAGQTVAGLFVPAGVIWTNAYGAGSGNWVSVASSADGTILVAVDKSGDILTSTNSGQAWSIQNISGIVWASACSSLDGTKMALAPNNNVLDQGGPVYTSTNSGLTWTAQTNGYWASIACSADSTKLLVAPTGPGVLIRSTNSGVTWMAQNSGSLQWKSVASSANGDTLVAVDQIGDIVASTNSGLTWSSQNPGVGWGSICSSSDGAKMALASYNGGFDQGAYIFKSTNSGLTWTAQTNGPFGYWSGIASSADGTKLVAAGNGIIYTSTNSGVTWTAQNSGLLNWTSVASSADGSKLVATADSGIYASAAVQYPYVGAANSTEQFQYLGNGVWQSVSISAGALPGSVVTNTEKGVTLSGTFAGNGNGLTNLNASQLASGTVPASALNGANGGGLTNLNASRLTSGIVPDALLSANVPLLSSGKLNDSVLSTNVPLLTGGNVALRSTSNSFNGTQIITNGNVGIGTTSPGFPLNFPNTLGDKISLWGNSGAHYGFGIQTNLLQIHTDSSAADIAFGSGQSTNLTETVRIKGNGNVGIGTNNPQTRLDVIGNGRTVFVRPNAAGQSSYLEFNDVAGAIRGLIGMDGSGFSGTANQFSIAAWTAHPMKFFTSGTERMSIGATGKVGIGTASPQKLLQVGDSSVSGSEGMIHFASRSPSSVAARDWDIGVPQTTNDISGVGYSFIIHDSGNTDASQLMVQFGSGNVGIGTNAPQQRLHVVGNILATGTVTGSSDRNVKRDFTPVNSSDVLDKVAALPISTWSYIADDGVRHLGPMAQDFYAAFNVGMNDKTISMVDADGVALAAIQGLNQKLEQRLEQKETEITELKAAVAELSAQMKAVNRK